MENVVEGYFAESTRQLQKQGRDGAPKLPPITGGGGSTGSKSVPQHTASNTVDNTLGESFALSQQPVARMSKDAVMRNLLEEKYEDLLKENERVNRKLRGYQDQLSIVSAKKMAYKTQSEKVEKELENMTRAFEAVQTDAQR